MKDLIKLYGEPWNEDIMNDLGITTDCTAADFYHNGGFEIHHADTGENVSILYALVRYDEVEIGCWIWYDWQDFDTDAEWMVLKEEDFSEQELTDIGRAIEQIYKKKETA